MKRLSLSRVGQTFLSALVYLVSSLPSNAVEIVRDGQPLAQVVIRANASPSEQRAASELVTHIERMTGARLAIINDAAAVPERAILIGDVAYRETVLPRFNVRELGTEGYYLKNTAKHVLVLGSDVRGAMYGTTALLEKLGVRWYTPTITATPTSRSLSIPELDERSSPAFEYREVYATEAFDKDWAARLRLNGQHHRLDASTGGKVRYSHFVHTFDDLIPRTEFGAHPEYFPFYKGKRQTGYVQRCLSNADVLKLAIAKVMEWIAKDPEALIFSVSQNDCYNFCECDPCKAIEKQYGGTHSGIYLWFVNQLAGEIEKKHPDKLIDTLAYQFTEPPPTGIKPRPNVRVRLCPIANCVAHPFTTCSASPTVKFMENLKGWAAITDTLYIWHYNTNFAHYLQPFPCFGEFPADTRLYKQSGVKGIFFEGAYGPGGGGSFAELQAFVMARMLWDPSANEKQLIDEWHKGVYAKAAAPMLEWFNLLHEQVQPADKHLFIYMSPKNAPQCKPEVLAKGEGLFKQALELSAGNASATMAVRKAQLGLTYVNLFLNPDTGKRLDDFLAELKEFKIGQIREGVPVGTWEAEFRAKHKK